MTEKVYKVSFKKTEEISRDQMLDELWAAWQAGHDSWTTTDDEGHLIGEQQAWPKSREDLARMSDDDLRDVQTSCTHLDAAYCFSKKEADDLFVDIITAGEDRKEREEREWYHRLHDGD